MQRLSSIHDSSKIEEAVKSSDIIRGPSFLSRHSRSLRGADPPGATCIEHYQGEQFYPGQFSPGVPRRNPWRDEQRVLDQRQHFLMTDPGAEASSAKADLVLDAQREGRASSLLVAASPQSSSSHEASQLAYLREHGLIQAPREDHPQVLLTRSSSSHFTDTIPLDALDTLSAIQEKEEEELPETPLAKKTVRRRHSRRKRSSSDEKKQLDALANRLSTIERAVVGLVTFMDMQVTQLGQIKSHLLKFAPQQESRSSSFQQSGGDSRKSGQRRSTTTQPMTRLPAHVVPGRRTVQRSLGKQTFDTLEQECLAKSLHQGAVLGAFLTARQQLERMARQEVNPGPARRSADGNLDLATRTTPSLVRNAMYRSLHERLARCEEILTERGPKELKDLAEQSRQSQDQLENTAAAFRASSDLSKFASVDDGSAPE